MRIKVRHETAYTYQQPATSALQLLRLTPRPFDSQFVRRWRVEVDTDARLDRNEDAFGNITHLVFVEGPISGVRIMIEGEVDTTDAQGYIRDTLERVPEGLFLRETPLTRASPEIRSFARSAAASEGGELLAALHRIMREIHETFAFRIGSTDASTTAAAAFAARSGVCQDYAHIFIAAARVLGVPARYISGYYLRSDTADQEAGHGWAEARVAGLGWIAFDPAQGHCITDRYVRIATGLDYLDAAPVRGARIGGRDEALSVAVQVQQGRQIVEG